MYPMSNAEPKILRRSLFTCCLPSSLPFPLSSSQQTLHVQPTWRSNMSYSPKNFGREIPLQASGIGAAHLARARQGQMIGLLVSHDHSGTQLARLRHRRWHHQWHEHTEIGTGHRNWHGHWHWHWRHWHQQGHWHWHHLHWHRTHIWHPWH
jgi:hypothetical protein